MLKKNFKKVLIVTLIIVVCAGVGVYASYLFDATKVNVTKGSSTVKLDVALDDLYSKTQATGFVTGQLVTYKNEPFYVLYDSGGTTVTLFAKTNLNQDATAQANAAYSTTACAFSSSQYWGDETGINLNNVSGYAATDVMGRVNTYAKTKGAISGRLLTYEEVNTLKNSYSDMIYGRGNTAQTNSSGLGYENYWLGSVDSNPYLLARFVRFVYGGGGRLSGDNFGNVVATGVRPVLEVLRSEVSAS